MNLNTVASFQKEIEACILLDGQGKPHSTEQSREKVLTTIAFATSLCNSTYTLHDREGISKIVDRAIFALNLQMIDPPFYTFNIVQRSIAFETLIRKFKDLKQACAEGSKNLDKDIKEINEAKPEKREELLNFIRPVLSNKFGFGGSPLSWLVVNPDASEKYRDIFLAAFPYNLNEKDNNQRSLLLQAAAKGNFSFIKWLKEHGAKLEYIPKSTKSDIIKSAQANDINTLRAYIEAGVKDFRDAFKAALSQGAYDTALFILKKVPPNDSVNILLEKDDNNDTLIKKLLDQLAIPSLQSGIRATILAIFHWAKNNFLSISEDLLTRVLAESDFSLATKLIQAGFDPNQNPSAIFTAVKDHFLDHRNLKMDDPHGSFLSGKSIDFILFLLQRTGPKQIAELDEETRINLRSIVMENNERSSLLGMAMHKSTLFVDKNCLNELLKPDSKWDKNIFTSKEGKEVIIEILKQHVEDYRVSYFNEKFMEMLQFFNQDEMFELLSVLISKGRFYFQQSQDFILKCLQKISDKEKLKVLFKNLKGQKVIKVFSQMEQHLNRHNKLAVLLGKPEIKGENGLISEETLCRVFINIIDYRYQVLELQQDLAEDNLPRPFYTLEDEYINQIQINSVHLKEKILAKNIPAPPADIDIRSLTRMLMQNNVKTKLRKYWSNPDEFIRFFSLRIDALALNQKIQDVHHKDFPEEYRNISKKILGWITKRFLDKEFENYTIAKRFECCLDEEEKSKLRQQLIKKNDELNSEIARILGQDLGESFLNCHGRTAHELQMIYYDLNFEKSSQGAIDAFESNTLPNKIKSILAKYRVNLFNSMFSNHLKVPTNIQPEYTLFYHNLLADEFGLGSKELSSVKTEYISLVNPNLTEEFRAQFRKLYSGMPQWFYDKLNDASDKEIPKQLVTDWIRTNYPDADMEDLLLPNGKWNYWTIASMLHDMGFTEWPWMNLPIDKRLARVHEHQQKIGECKSLEEACKLALKILKDGKRLLGKELTLASSEELQVQQKLELELEEQHKKLLSQMEEKVNQLYIGFEKHLTNVRAENSFLEVDFDIISNALNMVSFANETQFSEQYLKKFPQLGPYIAELRKHAKSLSEKKFILELKLIARKLADGCLEKDVKLAEELLKRLSKDKFVDITDNDKLTFTKEITTLIAKVKDQENAKKTQDHKVKESLEIENEKKNLKASVTALLKEWENKLNTHVSLAELNALEIEATSQPMRRKVNLADEGQSYRKFLYNLNQCKKKFASATKAK